jgi:hypothetical protein
MAQNLLTNQAIQSITLTLRLLGQDYPAIESEVAWLVRRIETRFRHRGKAKDRAAIVRAVKNSYHTASEISAATGIPYKTELKQAGVLRTTKLVDPTPQRGGDKKTLLYWLQSNWQELFKQTA